MNLRHMKFFSTPFGSLRFRMLAALILAVWVVFGVYAALTISYRQERLTESLVDRTERLATLMERLTDHDRRIAMLEAKIATWETLNTEVSEAIITMRNRQMQQAHLLTSLSAILRKH